MKRYSLIILVPLLAALLVGTASGQEARRSKRRAAESSQATDPNALPVTKLAPAKLIPNLCLLKYQVTTESPECQEFFDQGLGYYYSYVWMEAARSFEMATKHDPNCAMAWWGLCAPSKNGARGSIPWPSRRRRSSCLMPATASSC